MAQILKLSPKKRIEIVEAIWDSLADNPESVPVPASHIRELERRSEAYAADPNIPMQSWDTVKRQVRGKLGA